MAPSEVGPALQARGLYVRRGGIEALHGVSLSIAAGSVTGLFGPSGSGKSTLIRAIAGVQANVRGDLRVLGGVAGDGAVRGELGHTTQAPSVCCCAGCSSNAPRCLARFHAVSDLMPMTYAVDGMHHLTRQTGAAGALWGDIAIVLGFAAGALVLGAATLKRRTA